MTDDKIGLIFLFAPVLAITRQLFVNFFSEMTDKDSENDMVSLFGWIDSFPCTRPRKHINREFADAMPLVEILKHLHPKLVDVHNYTPRNSVSQKLANWDTLNRKVLIKLGVNLSHSTMEQLAQATPGTIERVLLDVKRKTEDIVREKEKVKQEQEAVERETLPNALSGTVVPLKEKDSNRTSEHKIVPLEALNKLESELNEKDEIIQSLNQKVSHLQSMVALKDERIMELQKQLQKLTGGGEKPKTFFSVF